MESSSSKVKHLKMNSTSEDEQKTILCTVAFKCQQEMENNRLHISLENCIHRIVNYTGLPKKVVHKLISKEFDIQKKYFEMDERILIFDYIANMHKEGKIPTYSDIFRWYQRKKQITFQQFQYMMSCLGFEYHRTHLGKEIIIEDPSQTFERYMYLKNIYNFRQKCAPIYYIDERFIDSTFTFPKLQWLNKEIDFSMPGCNGYVFFHVVSKQGFLNGLFCSPATKSDFIKWVSHILIPLLPQPSVIVMDNKDLHGSPVDTITKYHSKQDMLRYLRKRNVPCNVSLHKAELYELITKCTIMHNSYDIDEILKVHGHYVLRLPANFYDLSLTHFLWEHIESDQKFFLHIELSAIKTKLLDRLCGLPQEFWESFHNKLLETEKNIFKIDSKTSTELEKYKITTYT